MRGLTQHKSKNTRELHSDVYDRPEYVLRNPYCYTREEIDEARRVLWSSGSKRNNPRQ